MHLIFAFSKFVLCALPAPVHWPNEIAKTKLSQALFIKTMKKRKKGGEKDKGSKIEWLGGEGEIWV